LFVSTIKLNKLLYLNTLPILFRASLALKKKQNKVSFRLELHPAFKRKFVATERCLFKTTHTPEESSTRSLRTMGPSFFVYNGIVDRIQAVSRRFKLKSCTSLMDEQSNPC